VTASSHAALRAGDPPSAIPVISALETPVLRGLAAYNRGWDAHAMSELVGLLPPSINEDPVRRALDCLQEGFQIIGFDWTYIYLNPAAARHGRRAARELVGRPITEEYPGIETMPVFTALKRCMEHRIPQILENEFIFPDGSRRWFELRVQPVPEGICVYSTDIEHRKRKQLDLRQPGARGSFISRLRRAVGLR
jgi:PAS domain-containing protein